MSDHLRIAALLDDYAAGRTTPEAVISQARARIRQDAAYNAWIHVLDEAELAPYLEGLAGADPSSLPLYGVPFAIKDNIDLAGIPTTAGCPDYAYTPDEHAAVVARLIAAGALPLGKTNLDQFATGLVGTRSPYGACRNAFDREYLAGGSSSGSAVAVARGHVAFSLGTDTAGSGRIPAAFNGLVGLKPTRGLLSTRGVVPACRSLDCVSIFTSDAADAGAVLQVARGYDESDPFSRRHVTTLPASSQTFRFGVPAPAELEFFGNTEYQTLFETACARMEALGGERVEVDFRPFAEAAKLLYEGPWVAERYAAVGEFLERAPAAVHPVTRAILQSGTAPSAVDAFESGYRLAALRRAAEQALAEIDVLVTPTAGTHYRIADLEAEPVTLNTNLGYYTNFMNLLDLSGCAVPAGTTAAGLPFGVTLCADAGGDGRLLALAARLQGLQPVTSLPGTLPMVVCGAHLSGLPLNHQLTSRGGRLRQVTRTAPRYRFYALPGGPPYRPGLVRVSEGGAPVEVEVWELPEDQAGSFLAGIPGPLCIGRVQLEDGSEAPGFLCEAAAVAGAQDITHLGSWRDYLRQRGSG